MELLSKKKTWKEWQPWEDQFLRENYLSTSYRKIAGILARTKIAIDKRVVTLGLKKELQVHSRPLSRLPNIEYSESDGKWIACAIDTEGSIMLNRKEDDRCYNGYYYKVYISISNTNTDWLNEIARLTRYSGRKDYGSKIIQDKRQWKTVFKYTISSMPTVYTILKQILQWFIIKKEQALLAIEFIEEQDKVWNHKGFAYTERQHQIYEKMKKLNHRGLKSV